MVTPLPDRPGYPISLPELRVGDIYGDPPK